MKLNNNETEIEIFQFNDSKWMGWVDGWISGWIRIQQREL